MHKTILVFLTFFILLFCNPAIITAQVVINEFSSNTSDDWIELYSPTDVDISGWILKDTANSDLKTFANPTAIGPSTASFLIIEVENRLNNSGDTIKLLNSDNTQVDLISYGGAGQVCTPSNAGSIARVPNGGNTIDRLAAHTKGINNGEVVSDPCPTPTPIPTNTNTSTPTATKTPTNSPTATLTVKPTNTISPTSTKKPTPTEGTPQGEPIEEGDELILGASNELLTNTPTPSETPSKESEAETSFPVIAIIFIILGVGFIATAIFMVIKSRKIEYN